MSDPFESSKVIQNSLRLRWPNMSELDASRLYAVIDDMIVRNTGEFFDSMKKGMDPEIAYASAILHGIAGVMLIMASSENTSRIRNMIEKGSELRQAAASKN